MDEESARLRYWDAVRLLQIWIDYGPDSKEEILEELENDLDD